MLKENEFQLAHDEVSIAVDVPGIDVEQFEDLGENAIELYLHGDGLNFLITEHEVFSFIITRAHIRHDCPVFACSLLVINCVLEPHIELMAQLSVHFAQNKEVLILTQVLHVFADLHQMNSLFMIAMLDEMLNSCEGVADYEGELGVGR